MAVTYTNTSTRLTITSTGGVYASLADIETAVGNSSIFEDVGGGNYVLHRTGGDHKEFYINSGCLVYISSGETLGIEGVTTTATYNGIYLTDGATVYMESGSTIDMNYDGQSDSRYYFYLYGKMICDGAPNSYITISHYRSLYDYSRQATYWNYVHLKDNSYNSTGGYAYYFDNFTTTTNTGQRIYRNVKVTDINNRGRVYFYYFGTPVPGSLWEDWTLDGIYGFYCAASTVKLTRWTIKNLTDYIQLQGCGHNVGFRYITSKDDNDFTNEYFQPYFHFSGCSFINNDLGVYNIQVRYGSLVFFENCNFTGTTYGIYSLYGSRVLERGSNFESTTVERLWATNATFLNPYYVKIRVLDNDTSNPISNANVSVVHSKGYEVATAFTNGDGYIKNIYGNDMLLVNRENTSNGVYNYWSDDINSDRFHYIMATATGYTNYEGQYQIDSDKDITIYLTLSGSTSGGGGLPDKPEFKFITHKKIKGV